MMGTPGRQWFLFCNMLALPVLSIHSHWCGPLWSSCDLFHEPKESGTHCCPTVCQALPGGPAPKHWHPSKVLSSCTMSGPWASMYPPTVLSSSLMLSNLDGWHYWSHHPRPISLTCFIYLKPFSSYYLGYYYLLASPNVSWGWETC